VDLLLAEVDLLLAEVDLLLVEVDLVDLVVVVRGKPGLILPFQS
jgi:hypothetical protein